MKDKEIVLSPNARRAMAKVKMEMIRVAQVNIKNIFPALGEKIPKIHHTKSSSNTKKGSGRRHLQGK